MASHRRPKQPNPSYATALTVTAAAAVASLSTQSASADPLPDPNKKGVKAEVDRLHEDATQATEKYNGAKEKSDRLQEQVEFLQDTAARKQAGLNELRDRLGSIAAGQYRSGGLDPSVQLLLSEDPDTYLQKASDIDRLSARQVSPLQQFLSQQRALQQQRSQAAEKLSDLEDTRRELGSRKQEIQGKPAKAQQLLNTLTAEERARIAAEEERANRSSARVTSATRPVRHSALRQPSVRRSPGSACRTCGAHRDRTRSTAPA